MAVLFLLVGVLGACALSLCSVVSPGAASAFELLILHNNDMHARFEQTSQLSSACTPADRDAGNCYGGFPRVAHVVKEARRAAATGEGPPVLYLNAGDTYTGTVWFTIYKWKIAAEFINALQPDAVSLGNHEFDEKVEGLAPFIHTLHTPVLAANLNLNKVPLLRKEENLKNSTIITVNGVRVGIIGYLTPETQVLAPPSEVLYEDEVVALKREVAKLRSQGVKILIALGHSGYLTDKRIAREVDGIDLVIGGHSNTFLVNSNSTDEKPEYPQGPYPTKVAQPSGKIVPVVQAYAYTKYMGRLHLLFDADGEIIHENGGPILLDNSQPKDPQVYKMVQKYHKELEVIGSEVFGSSLVFLDGTSCRLRQCTIGNLMADAILNYTKETNEVCASIVFIQGGRIRSSIDGPLKPFNLTMGDWFTVIPFTDSLSVLTMNGTILRKALEHSADTWRITDSTGQFLQFAGMTVVYDLARPPGSRVVSAKAISTLDSSACKVSAMNDINESLEYKIIMPTFLAEGGDGFSMFVNLPAIVISYTETTSVIDYAKKYSPVNPVLDHRLTVLNEDKVDSDVISSSSLGEGRNFHSNAISWRNAQESTLLFSLLTIYYILGR